MAAQGGKQGQLASVGQGSGGEGAVGKETLLADVQVAHHLPVAPLEIPEHGQRLAHAAVLEHGPLQIEDEPLGALRGVLAQMSPL
ncbi:hypothetical protein D3C80_687240 [compost metagenome]